MNRRLFLSLVGMGTAGLAARSYFDMGAAWQKHGSLWLPVGTIVIMKDRQWVKWERHLAGWLPTAVGIVVHPTTINAVRYDLGEKPVALLAHLAYAIMLGSVTPIADKIDTSK